MMKQGREKKAKLDDARATPCGGKTLVWFRADLRTLDNAALTEATKAAHHRRAMDDKDEPGSDIEERDVKDERQQKAEEQSEPQAQPQPQPASVIGLWLMHVIDWQRHAVSAVQADLVIRAVQELVVTLRQRYAIPLYVHVLTDPSLATAFDTLSYSDFGSTRIDQVDKETGEDEAKGYGSTGRAAAIKRHQQELATARLAFAKWMVRFCKEHDVRGVFVNEQWEQDELQRDRVVRQALQAVDILWHSQAEQCLVPPGFVLTQANKPYSVFTPFKTQWLRVADQRFSQLVAPLSVPLSNVGLPSSDTQPSPSPLPLPSPSSPPLVIPGFEILDVALRERVRRDWPVDEASILARVDAFLLERVHGYKQSRDFPADPNATSKLSAYLAIGALSIRTLVFRLFLQHPFLFPTAAKLFFKPASNAVIVTSEMRESVATYLSELCWRDFYRHIMFFYPRVSRGQPFQAAAKRIVWRVGPEADADFVAWSVGRTGFPIVDAAMRQLRATGWMHNRLRMIVASFLAKHLLVPFSRRFTLDPPPPPNIYPNPNPFLLDRLASW